MRLVHAPHLGKNVVLGGCHIKPGAPQPLALRARNFLALAASAPVPTTTNFRAAADPVLREIYGNDELGDCLPAGFAHILGVETGLGGALYNETLAQVKSDYHAIGGYVDGDPSTDQGCDPVVGANYYCQHGWSNGVKGLAWLDVDATNPVELGAAMYYFGNLCFCVGLPDAYVDPFPSGDSFVWDVAGDAVPNNGHFFCGVDKTTNGIIVDTWALEGTFTFPAIAKYCVPAAGGRVFSILTPDIIARGSARIGGNGVAWADIVATFDKLLGGHVPVPLQPAPNAPPPPVGPAPVQPAAVPPSSDAVVAAARAAIASSPGFGPFVMRAGAEAAVESAVRKLFP